MGSVALRICRILENLHSVQAEITSLADEEVGGGPNRPRLEDSELQALHTVGLSVDHLRQVLRAYIEFATSNKGLPDVEEFYSLRAERTMQILRFACIGLHTRESNAHSHPASLFDELMTLAFDAVDRAGKAAELPPKIFASRESNARFEPVAVAS